MADKKQDLVDRYIRGEMNADERKAFETGLAEDEELREMYKYTAKVVSALKDREEKLEKINKWKTETPKTCFHKTTAGKIVYAFLGAAAVIAVILMLNRYPSMPELDVQKYECYRGASGVSHVAELINEGKYENAFYVIEKSEKSQKAEIDSINKLIPSATAQSLQRIEYQKSALKLDYEEMQWLKVYTLMGLERYDEAEKLLKEIIKAGGMYSEQADSLLQRFP